MPPKRAAPAPDSSRKGRKSQGGALSSTIKPVSKTGSARATRAAADESDEENAPTRVALPAAATDEEDELKPTASDSDSESDSDVAEGLTQSSRKKQKTAPSSASRKSTATVTASPPKKSSSRQALKGPAVSKSKSSSRTAAAAEKPVSSGTARKGRSTKAAPATASAKKTATKSSKAASKKRKETTTSASADTSGSDDDTDDESVPTTRSRSARGYTWEAEMIRLQPQDIIDHLTYHSSIKTEIDNDEDDLKKTEETKVKFRRDQIIYLLPDPHTLPPLSEEIEPEELADEEFWVGRILDCCSLDQGPGNSPLGILRIAWYYTADQLKNNVEMGASYKDKLTKHRFAEHEMIASDHVDFVGIDSFCGYPDGRVFCQLMAHGLEVSDTERMKADPALRKVSRKHKKMTGFPIKVGNTTKDGASPELALAKLSKETREGREKRLRKDIKRLRKFARQSKAAASDRRAGDSESGSESE